MIHHVRRRGAGLLCLLTVCLVYHVSQPLVVRGEQPESSAREETWFAIYLSGQRIGFQHSLVETVQQDGQPVIKTATASTMTIKRFGQSLVLKNLLTTEETPDGGLKRFHFEMQNPPASATKCSGEINGTQLTLIQEVNGEATRKTVAWDTTVKSPTFLDRALKANPLKAGETRTFDAFQPEFAKVAKVTLKAVGMEPTTLLDRTKRPLFKVVATQSLAPNIITDSFLDDKFDAVKISQSMVGLTIDMFVVPKEQALEAVGDQELDVAVDTLVKVDPILKGQDAKKIVYQITIAEQNPSEVLPTDDTQTVKQIDPQTAQLTVTALAVPPSGKPGKVAAEYLQASQYLQKDDERIRNHADKAAGKSTDAADIAVRMEKYVHDKLHKKNFSTAMASAGEVAKSLEGDCTEHAVLLAAMLRAKQIPSRIAVGLVYVESLFAFGGHMWTEVNLDGRWIPLDATRAARGTSAAYIKLADSSLNDDGPAALSTFVPLTSIIGKIKIRVLSVQ